MTIKRFLMFVWLDEPRPDRISEARWAAMLKWLGTRDKYKDWIAGGV